MSTVIRCDCKHDGQDQLHGRGMRVHNFATSHPDKQSGGWRCTVCKKEKPRNQAAGEAGRVR